MRDPHGDFTSNLIVGVMFTLLLALLYAMGPCAAQANEVERALLSFPAVRDTALLHGRLDVLMARLDSVDVGGGWEARPRRNPTFGYLSMDCGYGQRSDSIEVRCEAYDLAPRWEWIARVAVGQFWPPVPPNPSVHPHELIGYLFYDDQSYGVASFVGGYLDTLSATGREKMLVQGPDSTQAAEDRGRYYEMRTVRRWVEGGRRWLQVLIGR